MRMTSSTAGKADGQLGRTRTAIVWSLEIRVTLSVGRPREHASSDFGNANQISALPFEPAAIYAGTDSRREGVWQRAALQAIDWRSPSESKGRHRGDATFQRGGPALMHPAA